MTCQAQAVSVASHTLSRLFSMRVCRILPLLLQIAFVPALFGQDSVPEKIRTSQWPDIWGDLGVRGYATGDRVAPNGVEFEPLFDVKLDLNIGLLPQKKLYLVLGADFWGQRAAPGVTNSNYGDYDFSKREYDISLGVAWNVFDRFELRGSLFTSDNLNRGRSETVAADYENGGVLEARYYLGRNTAHNYDTGRLSFVSLGYYPGVNLIGGDGRQFRAGLFAEAYLALDIPILRSYIFLDARATAQDAVDVRLFTIDGGIGIRPIPALPNLELRFGDAFNADINDDITHNLVYGEVRAYFGASATLTPAADEKTPVEYSTARSPEIWGHLALTIDAAGRRMAANGVEFTPLFMSDVSFNIGIIPATKLYLFVDSQFWVQRENGAGTFPSRDPARDEVSEREWDMDGGLAVALPAHFEFRGALFAQNNLNRGGASDRPPSPALPAGYHDGGHLQLRYYLTSSNLYDPARRSFVEGGYYPSTGSLSIGGTTFRPGAFGRAYVSYDIPKLRAYAYGEAAGIASKDEFRLVLVNGGIAARPFTGFENLEFRVGSEISYDFGPDTTHDLTYGSIRINFSTR